MSLPDAVAPLTDDLFGGPPLPPSPPFSEVVTDPTRLDAVARELVDQDRLVLDIETSGLEWFRPEVGPVGWVLGYMRGGVPRTFYLPVGHRTRERQLDPDAVERALRPILLDPGKSWVTWNGKFDVHIAARRGIRPAGRVDDGMIQAHLLDENRSKRLKDVAWLRWGVEACAWELEVEKYRALLSRRFRTRLDDMPGFAHVPIGILGPYACQDGRLTLLLDAEQLPVVQREQSSIYDVEVALLQCLTDMEETGVPIDRDYVEQLKADLSAKEAALRRSLFSQVGEEFNPNSDAALRQILYGKLGFRATRTTRNGEPSTDKYALAEIARRCPAAQTEIDRREVAYLLSHYTDGILAYCDAAGVCHGSFNQIAAVSGRAACSDPNLHNVPRGPLIRRAFRVRGADWIRLLLDYSQIELRVLAWLSRDPVLVDAFLRGEDIHRVTGAGIFKVPAVDVTKDQRQKAKNCNFALRYGCAAKKFSLMTGYEVDECKRLIDDFWRHYAVTKSFIDAFHRRVRRDGCRFQNPFGRIRRVPGMDSSNGYERGEAERSATASLVSGTAADVMKIALVECWRYSAEVPDGGLLPVLTIHDELQFDARRRIGVGQHLLELKRRMENFPMFAPVPIVADVKWTATNWAEAEELKA